MDQLLPFIFRKPVGNWSHRAGRVCLRHILWFSAPGESTAASNVRRRTVRVTCDGLERRTPARVCCGMTGYMTTFELTRVVSSFIFFGLLAVLASACSPADPAKDAALAWKRGLFQRMQGNLSVPIAARVQQMPGDLLKATQDEDRSIGIANAGRYSARTATAEELALINSYIELLPRAHRLVFSTKLLAVYIVDGFSGAGMSEWVVDRGGHMYYYLILNSSLFTVSLDDWLTYKDDSPFDKSAAAPTIRVQTQTDYKALMYGLLHEGAHMVDYERGITPYLDQQHRQLSGRTRESSEFTNGVWEKLSQPVARYDFKHRRDLNIYGIYSARALIPRSELPGMFAQLKQTPFVSFYSGTSWNEDLADYLTYYHIERKLGGTVVVELRQAENVIDRHLPAKTPLAKRREKFVQTFYD